MLIALAVVILLAILFPTMVRFIVLAMVALSIIAWLSAIAPKPPPVVDRTSQSR